MAKKPENLSFEESLNELEHIVNELEKGDIPLDNSLKQFERGINLIRNSQSKLEQAQQKVSILMQKNDQPSLTNYTAEDESTC